MLSFSSILHAYLYADDMKLINIVTKDDDRSRLQDDLNKLAEWTMNWNLKLNLQKCGVLTIGCKNDAAKSYYISQNDEIHMLNSLSSEKDLGVIVDDELNFETHILELVKKANRTLGIIKRNFKHIGTKSFVLLYKALVRSKLEYAQNVWSPYKTKYIEMLEKVQRRATKLIPGMKKLSYQQRLQKLKLPSLTFRRVRGDMIEVYKMLHGFYDSVNCPNLQLQTTSITRGHNFKLFKQPANKNLCLHFFSLRIVDIWNSLPHHVVNAQSINMFKNSLDKYWNDQDLLTNFRSNINNRPRDPEACI